NSRREQGQRFHGRRRTTLYARVGRSFLETPVWTAENLPEDVPFLDTDYHLWASCPGMPKRHYGAVERALRQRDGNSGDDLTRHGNHNPLRSGLAELPSELAEPFRPRACRDNFYHPHPTDSKF